MLTDSAFYMLAIVLVIGCVIALYLHWADENPTRIARTLRDSAGWSPDAIARCVRRRAVRHCDACGKAHPVIVWRCECGGDTGPVTWQ